MKQFDSLKTGDKFKKTEVGEIPVDWEVVKIEDCCDILDSQRIPLNDTERRVMKGDFPYYGTNGILDKINDYIFDDDLILIAEDGGYFEDYKYRPIAYLISGKCWVNNHAHVLRSKKYFFREWIFYNVVHKNIISYIGGGTRSKLNQKELRAITIPAPPIHEQKKITEILSAIDEAIEKKTQIIEKIKELKKALMQELLTKGIGHRKFKKTEIGEIPVDWEIKTLINAVGINNNPIVAGPFGSNLKVEDYRDTGVPIIRLQNIEYCKFINKDIKYISMKKADELNYHSFKKGDIILAKLGDPIGKTCIIPESMEKGIVVADVVRIRIDEQFSHKKFIMYILNSFYGKKQLNREIIGTTRPRVNLYQVRNIVIPCPPLAEQKKIANILSLVDNEIENEIVNKERLIYIKKGLMQVLLTGILRVKV